MRQENDTFSGSETKKKFLRTNKIVLWIVFLSMLALVSGAAVVRAATDTISTSIPVIQVDLLNQDPNPARAGDTADLRFKLENSGGVAVEKMVVELLQDYPFSIASGDAVKSLGNINAGLTGNNYITFEYIVKIDKDNAQAQRELSLRYKYNNGEWITEKFMVNIASKEFAQIIYVDKAQLDPGKETEMKFTITNVGNAPLQNLVFSWNEADGLVLPVYSSDTKYVKYLDAGESVELTYTVIADVNANPGLYQLDLKLESESTNNATPMEINTKAGVFIGGETDFDVAFSESSAGQTSLSVSNIGNNPAQSVSVIVPQQQNFRVSGSNSAIIGNLDKGDYTLVSFQIASALAGNISARGRQDSSLNFSNTGRRFGGNETFGNAGNNPDNLRVMIYYTDTTGDRISVEKNVSIQFRSSTITFGSTSNGAKGQSSSSFIGSTVFWAIIVVVAVGICVFVYGKKTRAKKEKMILSERRR